jgi:hypothetical protein
LFLIFLFVLFVCFPPPPLPFLFSSTPPVRHSSFRSSRHCLMPLLCGMFWFVDVAVVVGRGGRMLR